jgi:hypothetical protein
MCILVIFSTIFVLVFLNQRQVEPAVGAALLAWSFLMKESYNEVYRS